MHIRKVTPPDKEALMKLIKAMETSDEYLSEPQKKIGVFRDFDASVREAAERYITNPEYLTFVADDKGFLTGFICGIVKEKKHRVYNKQGYVELWYVDPSTQGHGVGKELFDILIEEFKKAACTHLALDTYLENAKAIEIYEHMGFTKRLVTFFKPLHDLS